MRTTLIFTFLLISLEKMIAGVIFLIIFRFLRYSLTLLSQNLPSKSSYIIQAVNDCQNPKLPNIFKASLIAASQPSASRQLASEPEQR